MPTPVFPSTGRSWFSFLEAVFHFITWTTPILPRSQEWRMFLILHSLLKSQYLKNIQTHNFLLVWSTLLISLLLIIITLLHFIFLPCPPLLRVASYWLGREENFPPSWTFLLASQLQNFPHGASKSPFVVNIHCLWQTGNYRNDHITKKK